MTGRSNRKKTGAQAVQEAMDAAIPAEASEADDNQLVGPEKLLRRFKMLETGLHIRKDEGLIWISAPFKFAAETQDENGRWGVLIEFRDRAGVLRQDVFSRDLFAGDCKEVRNRLAAAGLTISGNNIARNALVEYLNIARSADRARVVERTGWHRIGKRDIFVLPDNVFGEPEEQVVLQSLNSDKAPFGCSGTLDLWKSGVSYFALNNTRLAFSVSLAFAGPLLFLADQEGGGFNLCGQSRAGKTTALRVAASVWGNPGQFMRSWRATANGLESVACQYSDTLLPLDEMGQVDAKDLGDVAYMLANGSGKARSGRDGSARPPARWRVLFLSTGELGIHAKVAEARKTAKAGQEIRLIDLPADAGAGFGLFEELHEFAQAGDLADHLRTACRQAYGSAGVKFLEALAARQAKEPDFAEDLRREVERISVSVLLGKITTSGGQLRSAASRFALVAFAGEMATRAGITGWHEGWATQAVTSMFTAWLKDRGTTGASEDERAKRQLAAFVGRYGSGRFEIWGANDEARQVEESESPGLPTERVRPHERAGWRRHTKLENGKYGYQYHFTKNAMEEALSGLDFRASVRALVGAGMIVPDKSGKSTHGLTPPGVGKSIRLYVVPADVIGYGGGAED